jgi:hypothetical protein
VAVLDGVFTLAEGAERAEFHTLATPKEIDMDTLALNVEIRVLTWLRRRGWMIGGPLTARTGEAYTSSMLKSGGSPVRRFSIVSIVLLSASCSSDTSTGARGRARPTPGRLAFSTTLSPPAI